MECTGQEPHHSRSLSTTEHKLFRWNQTWNEKCQYLWVYPIFKKYYLLSFKSEMTHVNIWPRGFDILLFHWPYWQHQEPQLSAQILMVSRTKATNRGPTTYWHSKLTGSMLKQWFSTLNYTCNGQFSKIPTAGTQSQRLCCNWFGA